jgi:hypothetical protein
VRVIFVDTTLPVSIRPRIEMSPVKGHFLSSNPNSTCQFERGKAFMKSNAPIYVPLIASAGVLKPRPTSLYHRFSFVAIFLPPFHSQPTVSMLTRVLNDSKRTPCFGILEEMLFLESLLDLNSIVKSGR